MEAKGTGFVYVHSNLVMNYQFSDFEPDSPSVTQQNNTAVYLLRNSSAEYKLMSAVLKEVMSVREDDARLMLMVAN